MNITTLKAPLNGVLIPLDQLPDEVFATRVLGDGVAIEPITNLLHSPCDGEIVQLHKSHHALTIQTPSGEQILMHIGINTVNLNGEGFTPKVKQGDRVKCGDELIEFDMDFIAKKKIPLSTVIINLNQDSSVKILNQKDILAPGDELFEIKNQKNKNTQKINKAKNTHSQEYKVQMPAGMHARPAAKISDLAKNLNSHLEISFNNNSANASSVVSVLSLGIEKDSVIQISSQNQGAINKLIKLLDEITEHELKNYKEQQAPAAETHVERKKNCLYGVSASEGIAIGEAFIVKESHIDFPEESKDQDGELAKLEKAITSAINDLSLLEEKLVTDHQEARAAIFSAHKEILKDQDLVEEAKTLIKSWKSAAFAWNETITKRAQKLESLKNELIAARANDIRDVGHRVLKILTGADKNQRTLNSDTILIANDLTPSDIIELDTDKVIGFVTVCGGATSHVAILARSMGIPAIAGMSEEILNLKIDQKLILDAHKGELNIAPDKLEIDQALKAQKAYSEKLALAQTKAHELTYTKNQKRIKVVANIGSADEAKKAAGLGAEGVGLLRTEFIFLDRKTAPTQSEQEKIYQDIHDAFNEQEIIIRTLDIGGDKQLNYLPMKAEENPFLGVRGIRFCFKNEGLFREQLRAILKTKSSSPLHIMFPMVGQISELKKAKAILNEEREKLNLPMPKIGIMIEVPSAALMAKTFAPEVDFFSIGTNDLTQYTLATDRGHSELAASVDGLNPGVLRLIDMTCQAAKEHNVWVGVCGGVASEIAAAPVLLSLGVSELSISMPSIALIKAALRELDTTECEKLRERFLNCHDASEVRKIVSQTWPDL